jgi:hypothetical protein
MKPTRTTEKNSIYIQVMPSTQIMAPFVQVITSAVFFIFTLIYPMLIYTVCFSYNKLKKQTLKAGGKL